MNRSIQASEVDLISINTNITKLLQSGLENNQRFAELIIK